MKTAQALIQEYLHFVLMSDPVSVVSTYKLDVLRDLGTSPGSLKVHLTQKQIGNDLHGILGFRLIPGRYRGPDIYFKVEGEHLVVVAERVFAEPLASGATVAITVYVFTDDELKVIDEVNELIGEPIGTMDSSLSS